MTQVGKEGQVCLKSSVENSDNKDCRPKVLKENKYIHIKFAVWLFGDRSVQFSSFQLLSHVWLFVTPWNAARQASLSIINSWSPSKHMSIVSVMPSNHLILCRPFLLPPLIFPNTRVFSNKCGLHIRWPKYWSFSFNIRPSKEYSVEYLLNLLN